jgi:phosphatidylethanolamine-binding protein (PEBP) family uncharacterized protein
MRMDPAGLMWDAPNLAGPDTLDLQSADFAHYGALSRVHAAERAGGQNLSPALTWNPIAQAAQLLLVVEDPDAPTRRPYLHCLAFLDGAVSSLDRGDLSVPLGHRVQLAVSALGDGYFGPAPPKTHGPHRYIFQLFALRVPLVVGTGSDPRSSVAQDADVLARGRLDGTYQRG